MILQILQHKSVVYVESWTTLGHLSVPTFGTSIQGLNALLELKINLEFSIDFQLE